MNKQSRIWIDEEEHKDKIYRHFEYEKNEASKKVQEKERALWGGKYEDQYNSLYARGLADARRKLLDVTKRIKALYNKPYYAHVQVTDKENGDSGHYFLTDSTELDSREEISDIAWIIPFKQTTDRPEFYNIIYQLFETPSKDDFTITVPSSKPGAQYTIIYTPNLIRDVEVTRGVLQRVEPRLPEMDENEQEEYVGADELLAEKLRENRTDARLRNIISTLQREQFKIIQSDTSLNFVVQGCAGSGKTQCLIHRLFFLRGVLSERGWDQVLLITPTQLFRNYSSEMMRSFRLTDVNNCSLADFYCQLLQSYDARFRNRQYQFELTEEYLPDKYLQRVYAPTQIAEIEREIQNAIRRHVEEGCALAEIEFDDRAPITIDFVNLVAKRLSEEIQRFDETEKAFENDQEYKDHRDAINELDRQIKTLQRKQADLLKTHTELAAAKERYDKLISDFEEAKADETDWERSVEEGKKASAAEVKQHAEAADAATDAHEHSLSAKRYAIALYHHLGRTVSDGEQAMNDQFQQRFLHSVTEECQAALNELLKKQTPTTWLRNYERRHQENQTKLSEVKDDNEDQRRI